MLVEKEHNSPRAMGNNCGSAYEHAGALMIDSPGQFSPGLLWKPEVPALSKFAFLSPPKHQNQTTSKRYGSKSLPHLHKGHISQYFNISLLFADNVSWRLNTDGSLFISHLIHYFREFSCCHHLEEIFRKVGVFLSFHCSVLENHATIFKPLFENPEIW